ncbi:uncharacterized protein LOC135145296 [Zophobas morio]|uniref:uncharacterized protein LOC135145296 n=1 Tax=Zophobas morio TaxID=2755281 RepID=UPI003083BAC2
MASKVITIFHTFIKLLSYYNPQMLKKTSLLLILIKYVFGLRLETFNLYISPYSTKVNGVVFSLEIIVSSKNANLLALVDNEILPIVRDEESNRYQVSWVRALPQAKAGEIKINFFEASLYKSLNEYVHGRGYLPELLAQYSFKYRGASTLEPAIPPSTVAILISSFSFFVARNIRRNAILRNTFYKTQVIRYYKERLVNEENDQKSSNYTSFRINQGALVSSLFFPLKARAVFSRDPSNLLILQTVEVKVVAAVVGLDEGLFHAQLAWMEIARVTALQYSPGKVFTLGSLLCVSP